MYVKTEEFVGIVVELCALKKGIPKEDAMDLRDKTRQEVYDALREMEK